MSTFADGSHVDAIDLDAFLTQIESKLRGPFTSLDFAKACALNEKHSILQYLSNILKVLPRAEKITQLRILIGILGLEPSNCDDAVLRQILATAQVAATYEEWVRVIAGIVDELLFGLSQVIDSNESSDLVKNEANEMLDKTCIEIMQRVQKLERDTSVVDEFSEHLLAQSDANPAFVPYRYDLLTPNSIQSDLPELASHRHFLINKDSDILLMDMKIETERMKEEHEHVTVSAVTISEPPTLTSNKQPATSSRFEINEKKPVTSKLKVTSMFLERGKQDKYAFKPLHMHQRKAGAAQALLAKGRRGRMTQSGIAPASEVVVSTRTSLSRPTIGRTTAVAASVARGIPKSKMKMIDVAEVQGLEIKKQHEIDKVSTAQKVLKTQTVMGKKRSNVTTTDVTGVEPSSKLRKNNMKTSTAPEKLPIEPLSQKTGTNTSPVEEDSTGELASAVLLAYQSQIATFQPETQNASLLVPTAQNSSTLSKGKQQYWRELLQSRSNRLSDEDRKRIHHFYVDRYNPTPEQRNYKMKLHEERITDPSTGKALKETFYLELDYNTYTSKQTKKVKRYKDDTCLQFKTVGISSNI
jgi:hypothetical protein